jgi:hypothetical protein
VKRRHGMDALINFEDLVIRNQVGILTPAKLATLKRVFDAVCEEYKIPLAAKTERNDLAHQILTAASTIDHESLLLVFARNAVAKYRR